MSKSKRKGTAFERTIANQLSNELGQDVQRTLLSGIRGEGDIQGLPVHIEVKRCEHLRLNSWFEKELPKAGNKPFALIHKQSRQPAMVTMTLDHWIWLFREAF